MAAQRVDARVERRVGAARGVGRERAGHQRRLQQRLGLEQAGQRVGRGELRAVEQRQPFLRAEHDRREPGGRQAPPRAGSRPAGVNASPTPIMTAVMCASGARSPDAPTEPCAGTTGMTPFASMPSSSASVAGRTPDAPWARLASFSAIISRATGTGIGSPTPAACESTMLRCSVSRSPVRDAHAGQLPEAGIDAVDGLALGEDASDGRRALSHDRCAGGIERRHRASIDAAPGRERNVARLQDDRGH